MQRPSDTERLVAVGERCFRNYKLRCDTGLADEYGNTKKGDKGVSIGVVYQWLPPTASTQISPVMSTRRISFAETVSGSPPAEQPKQSIREQSSSPPGEPVSGSCSYVAGEVKAEEQQSPDEVTRQYSAGNQRSGPCDEDLEQIFISQTSLLYDELAAKDLLIEQLESEKATLVEHNKQLKQELQKYESRTSILHQSHPKSLLDTVFESINHPSASNGPRMSSPPLPSSSSYDVEVTKRPVSHVTLSTSS
eukprot:GHVN01072342.1.p1 GENE.GHVN01072342.1~~GHVN01072342.1.p1  ORF type:complete len:250 (+),score=32.86 GHVN01072342.1:41-790(+)